ncbi:XdhC family protein [Thalassotalea euphylliae]|uniref:XdhC family protein n=1 Tax=Thalassotalea euphylliae TaxID=1655234 RepID=UPI00363C8DF5
MSTSLKDILATWYPRRDETEWVLCTLFQTEGSSYRKPGAMMMFSGDGAQLGILSGGCLEGDIQRHAQTVMASQKAKTITYDATDEDDVTFQLGIGCGGVVHILMQPVCAENNYLALENVFHACEQSETGLYKQVIPNSPDTAKASFSRTDVQHQWSLNRRSQLESIEGVTYLVTHIFPEPHLLVIGGGFDARPVTQMAKLLGWRVSLWDQRPANARQAYFKEVDNICEGDLESVAQYATTQNITGVILMSHSVSIDAKALAVLHSLPCAYIGLLGPIHRKQQVIEQSGIHPSTMQTKLSGPIGLDLGGETPESIALCMLSEMHAVICQRNGKSISQVTID